MKTGNNQIQRGQHWSGTVNFTLGIFNIRFNAAQDYIAEAKRKGIKLFAITDHGPDMADAPHYWHFVNNFTLGIFNIRFNAAQDADAIYQTRPDTHIDEMPVVRGSYSCHKQRRRL
jgi:hypothetical protein